MENPTRNTNGSLKSRLILIVLVLTFVSGISFILTDNIRLMTYSFAGGVFLILLILVLQLIPKEKKLINENKDKK